jgi:hypothetical protein
LPRHGVHRDSAEAAKLGDFAGLRVEFGVQ